MTHYTAHITGHDGVVRQFNLQAMDIEQARQCALDLARDIFGADARFTFAVWPRWS